MNLGRSVLRLSLLAGAALSIGIACGGPVNNARRSVRSIDELTDSAKAALAGQRIFFGHQSVGANIMQGVSELVGANQGLKLQVVGPGEAWPASGGFFAHGKVGSNGAPSSKTDDFAKQMAEGLGSRVGVAFHKYCYIDFPEGTDPGKIFGHYRDTMARLRAKYPAVIFVHVTVPVTVVQTGPKAVVKRMLGRAPGGYADNIRREQFNALMRREYAGPEPLFDLAAIESADAEGTQQQFEFKGQTGLALFPPYASDGRHLGDLGRRRVAEELLVLLASIPSGGAR
jgi:hypothetical protein